MRRLFEVCESPFRLQRGKSVVAAMALLCTACSTVPSSGVTRFQAALFNPVQIFSEEADVVGWRFNLLYGKNAKISGYDCGMVGIAEAVTGAQTNAFYSEAGDLIGVQLAALPGNRATNVSGVQFGGANVAEGRVEGYQLAGVANETQEIAGGQVAGFYNKAERVVGFQFSGFVNVADDLRGLQLGVLNFNRNGLLPFFPILNFGFGSASEDKAASEY